MQAIMTGSGFNRLIDATKRFAGKSGGGMLEWIQLEFCKESCSCTAAAIDGHRFSVERCECVSVDGDFKAYIMPGIRKVGKKSDVILILNNGRFLIQDGEAITGYKQPQGTFYEYRAVLQGINARENKYMISFNGKLLMEAVHSALITDGGFGRNPITLEFAGEHAPIVLRTGKDNVKIVMPMRTAK
jgi:DNA polymerase III sliding clamp (beta) subunit (PCNA family)